MRGQLPAGVFFAVFVGLAGASGPSSPCPANSVALESAVASGTCDQHCDGVSKEQDLVLLGASNLGFGPDGRLS